MYKYPVHYRALHYTVLVFFFICQKPLKLIGFYYYFSILILYCHKPSVFSIYTITNRRTVIVYYYRNGHQLDCCNKPC